LQHQANTVVGRLCRLHVDAVHEAHAMLLARQRETARELVDVAGRIGCREIAAVVAALQRRFDPGDFFRADRMALQPTRYQQGVGFTGRCEARLVVIDVQDATSLQVEIDLLTFCHREQMLARVDGHARGFDRVCGDSGRCRRRTRRSRNTCAKTAGDPAAHPICLGTAGPLDPHERAGPDIQTSATNI
jgi:hypothetical protein